jgi:hypothetical protein
VDAGAELPRSNASGEVAWTLLPALLLLVLVAASVRALLA